jgi:hypothetical protein
MVPSDAIGISKKLPDSLVQPTEADSYLGAYMKCKVDTTLIQRQNGKISSGRDQLI